MSQRFEGRNLEEALETAAQTLGVDRWKLTYHVLLEKRGFLGGVKRVVIEADVNEEAPQPAAPPPAQSAPEARTTPRGDRGPRGRGGRGGGGGGGGGRREGGNDRGRGRRGGRHEHRDDFQPGDFERFMVDAPEQGAESDGARSVREWCDDVIALARLDVVTRSEETDEQITIRLYGPDTNRLIDRHGELLDALQVLANKALTGRRVEKDIELDCEEFKGKRTEELAQRAKEVAERVRRDGREELLPAMTPIERRIVHLALRDDEAVTTISRGEGFYKRVAVVLRGTEESAEAPPEQ
ncbi:MAG TPA: R3H domain-containing nucleic acid-binding protein [Thermoanaerobaculia bacterium]|nr:R3H domain-containing nucleic acid-binding protein [Thermoanaerobaculia bacterium]